MTRPFPLLGAALFVGCFAFAKTANALGPVDVEIGGRVGYGGTPSNFPSGSINPLGVGLGARAGVDFFGFYGGLNVMYYFGGTVDGFSEHSLMEGIEFGYSITLPLITIRPVVGFGHWESSGGGSASDGGVTVSVSDDTGSLYVEPGVTVLHSFGVAYVAADVSALLLTYMPQASGSTALDTALTVEGQVGCAF
jgi:hypothetical protein